MQIHYLDGSRLRRSLLAACDYAQRQRDELNRINVFPVPDGDTGTNLTLTVRAIVDTMEPSRATSVAEVARGAANAAVMGARGNCGMMLSHFLLGFAEGLSGYDRVNTAEFCSALRRGAQSLREALDKPVEGTILTVIHDTALAATQSTAKDFVPLLELNLRSDVFQIPGHHRLPVGRGSAHWATPQGLLCRLFQILGCGAPIFH